MALESDFSDDYTFSLDSSPLAIDLGQPVNVQAPPQGTLMVPATPMLWYPTTKLAL
jgi:hypothetical protein